MWVKGSVPQFTCLSSHASVHMPRCKENPYFHSLAKLNMLPTFIQSQRHHYFHCLQLPAQKLGSEAAGQEAVNTINHRITLMPRSEGGGLPSCGGEFFPNHEHAQVGAHAE